jgi:hypothetical protein
MMTLKRDLAPGEGFVRLPPKQKKNRKKHIRNNAQKNCSMSMKRHWNTPKKDQAMEDITIKRCDMHLVMAHIHMNVFMFNNFFSLPVSPRSRHITDSMWTVFVS